MTNENGKLESLENLFEAYFHYDWADEHDYDSRNVMKYYCESKYPHSIEKTYQELTYLLDKNLEDKELQLAFDKYVGEYLFDFNGKANEFLRDIQYQLAEHLGLSVADYQKSQKKQSETTATTSSDTKSGTTDKKNDFKSSARKSETPVPKFEQAPKSSSNLFGCFLIFALLGVGCAGSYYIFSQLFASENNTTVTNSPTPTSKTPEMQFKVVKKQINDGYWEFLVSLPPGQMFDTGIPITANNSINIIAVDERGQEITDRGKIGIWHASYGTYEGKRESFLFQLSHNTFEKSGWEAGKEVMQLGECDTLKLWIEGKMKHELKVTIRNDVLCRWQNADSKHIELHKQAKVKAKDLLAKIK